MLQSAIEEQEFQDADNIFSLSSSEMFNDEEDEFSEIDKLFNISSITTGQKTEEKEFAEIDAELGLSEEEEFGDIDKQLGLEPQTENIPPEEKEPGLFSKMVQGTKDFFGNLFSKSSGQSQEVIQGPTELQPYEYGSIEQYGDEGGYYEAGTPGRTTIAGGEAFNISPTGNIQARPPLPDNMLSATAYGATKAIPFISPEGADIDQLQKDYPGSVTAGEIAGNVGLAMAGGAGVANVLGKTAVAKSPILFRTLSRVIPAVALRGGQSAEQVLKGKSDIKEALYNTLVESGGGAAFSIIPEIVFPPGIAQLIAQPLADIIYQSGIDVARGDKNVLSKEWFKEQLPTIAMSAGFALVDVASGETFKAEQREMRGEIKNWMKGKGSKGFEIVDQKVHQKPVEPFVSKGVPKEVESKALEIETMPAPAQPKIEESTELKQLESGFKEKVRPEVVGTESKQPQKRLADEDVAFDFDEPDFFPTGKKEGLLEGEGGAVRTDLLKSEGRKNHSSAFAKYLKKNFTAKGDLPKPVFDEKVAKDGWINAELKEIEWTVDEFRKTTQKLSDKEKFIIDETFKGQRPIEEVPENVQPIIKRMRNHTDALSQHLIDNGIIEGDLALRVTENMGTYATRSYRVFDDPKWAEKVPVDVRNRAKAFVQQEASDFYNKKVEATNDVINNLLSLKTKIETTLKNPLSVEQRLNIEEKVDELDEKIGDLLSQKEELGFDAEDEINEIAKKILDIRFGEQRTSETDREFKFHQDKIDRLNREIDVLAKGKKTKKVNEEIKTAERQIKQLEEKMENPLTGTQIDKYETKLEKINSRIDKLVDKIPEFQRKARPTEGELHGQIDELLYKEGAPVNILSSGSKLGSKNLGILKRRKDIPAEIRALWGEYKEADINYARSVSKMAHLIANHNFLNNVAAKGKGEFFFKDPLVKDGNSYSVKFAAEGNPALKPLAGLYTTKEIKKAFEDAVEKEVMPDWLKLYMKANSAVKYSKTIGSAMTHVRNVTGNVSFAVANGHFNTTKMGKAIKTTLSDINGKPRNEMRKYIKELTRLGVVSDGARSGEIRAIIQDATQGDLDVLIGTGPRAKMRQGLKAIEKLYGAEDDVWKIFAFENEYTRYRKALPSVSEQELKKRVANIVRDTYPTYSMIPRGIRKLRRFPLVGTFVSFPAEVMRTAKNTIALTAKELKDPKLRAVGAQRLTGTLLASTATVGLVTGARYLSGVTKKKEDAAREFLPPWSQNSQIIFTSPIENGKGSYIDLGYTDPHSYIKNSVIAFMRGDDWENKIYETGAELLSPFLSEDIMTQKLLDIKRNKTKEGQPVYNPQDSFEKKTTDVLAHVIEAIEPGTLSGMRRIYRASEGQEGKAGTTYDVKTEVTAQTTGVRVSKLDVKRSLMFHAYQFGRDKRDASRLARKRNISTSFDSKKRLYDDFSKKIQAARMSGMSNKDIYRTLNKAGLSWSEIGYLKSGKFEKILNAKEKIKIGLERAAIED